MDDDRSKPSEKGILHPEGMRAARDLAAGVVHEINNVLGVIIGNAHLAKKNASSQESVEKYISEVRDAAEEGRELMRDLAILAGDESPRPRILSLNDLVNNAASALDTPVELDLSSDDPPVELDLWLAQDALVSAAKFMASARAATWMRIATRVVGSATALTLEDDAGTPSEKELATLFTPFARVDHRPKVALSLTKLADLAARSGGYVTAAVREPRGLRIVLTLPVARVAASGDGPGVALPEEGV